EGADHAGQQVLRRAEAVVASLIDAAAAKKEKSAKQASGVMNAAGGRPAIGAAHDRPVAKFFAHTRNLPGNKAQCLVPGNFLEAVSTGAFRALAPPLANRGPRNAQRRMHHRWNRLDHVGRRRIARKRLATDYASILDQRREGAPVGKRRETCDAHA